MRSAPPVVLLITAAAGLWVPDIARADACSDVRRVRALAAHEGVDDSTLRTLERRVCPGMLTSVVPIGTRPRAEARAAPRVDACADYAQLGLLARADDRFAGERLAWIDAARAAACRGLVSAGAESWPNGVAARDAYGNWFYPNGLRARAANGTWYYPNGLVARRADGSWQYANGVRAKSADGRWYRPNGQPTSPGELLRRACTASRDAPLCAAPDAPDPSPLEAELVLLTFHDYRASR